MAKLISLSGGGYTAVIDLSHGANCVSLRHEGMGARILRECTGKKDNPYLYGMPVLFPANRISGGAFSFDGRVYRFPVNEEATGCHLHGFLHETPVKILARETDTLRVRIPSPYSDFPHLFEIEMRYSLSEKGFLQEVTVRNLSGERMPAMLAFHTTFSLPFLMGSRAEDVTVQADVGDLIERTAENYLPTGKITPPDEITHAFLSGSFSPTKHAISRHYRAAGKGRISLTDNARRVRLMYENDAAYPFRLFYNGGAKDFLCLEPMTSLANAPNAPFSEEEAGLVVIPPHSEKTYFSRIYLEDLS